MSKIPRPRLVSVLIVFAFVAALPSLAQASALPAAAPDAGLFTTYTIYDSGTTVDWVVCGSTSESEGCYDSGSLGPFVQVGAMLESNASVSGDTVTRHIYVVDSGPASVVLYVYKKTDTVTSSFDTTVVTLTNTITLPLTGGTTATCSMAANNDFLFIGTNQGEQGVMVQKSNLKLTKLGIYIVGINITSITSDAYGYVTVTQTGADGISGFAVFGPNGDAEEDGGGADFVLGTTQAVPLGPLTSSNAQHLLRSGHHPKPSGRRTRNNPVTSLSDSTF